MKKSVHQHLKHYFVPHEGNNYKPEFLHPKRALFYSAVLLAVKAVAIVFVALLPAQAFVLPDILAEQQRRIVSLTNQLREEKSLPTLKTVAPLVASADEKALDMASRGYFSHIGPDGHTLSYFLKEAGYRYSVAGENLAMGFSDAESVVNAWIKSPSHYANLVDTDYTEFGLSLESGDYNGVPTVFVAQHFGRPEQSEKDKAKDASAAPSIGATTALQPKVRTVAMIQKVQGEKILDPNTVPTSTVVVDRARSFVDWQDIGAQTRIAVSAFISGSVKSATANVDNYPIELTFDPDRGYYQGALVINESSDSLFKTVILPTVSIVTGKGEIIHDTLSWKHIKVVADSPIEKYLHAKKLLAPITGLFAVSQWVYVAFFVVFALALLINVLVEVRRQHYHIILQTLFILALIIGLYYV